MLPASMPEAQRINDFVYASHGLSNTYMVSTSEGRVVINTGMGFESPVHKRNFDAADSGLTRYILLTQAHVDHVGGVDQFLEAGTEVVAQAGNPAHQQEDARLQGARRRRSMFAFAAAIAGQIRHDRAADGPVPTQSRPEPTIAFDERFDFELGGVRFECLGIPAAETNESMVVWLPESRILFTGNLFGALWGHIPNLVTVRGDRYRDPLVVIAAIDRVLALEPDLILYGHHDPIEGAEVIRRELTRLRGAMQFIHDRTVEAMNAGGDVWTAMREIRLPPELEVGEGYGKVSWNVRAIWENYLGWFQHQSTNELFGAHPTTGNADLVELAGGPDAIAKRARERLESGDCLEAIALCDVVESVDPEHVGAIEVAIAAHERLDADSENFWLSSWLRERVRQLNGKLVGP
jgi:alkyl sulfatase BDS1-like metallo-beta-lactamase superfamily hydrolase